MNQEFVTSGELEITQRVDLGKTGLQVTPLCVGAAPLGNMKETFGFSVSAQSAGDTLRHFFSSASPSNFVDTASVYGDSEVRIGNVLREIGGLPHGFVIATKADRNIETGDFSADQVRRSVELSQQRLGLNTLQLVYLHDPERSAFSFEQIMAKNGPVDALLDLQRQGIIQHIGISGGPVDLLQRFVETDVFEAVITHNRFNLVWRTAEPLLSAAHKKGIGVVNAAPFASGVLAKGSKNYPRVAYKVAPPDILKRIQQIEKACEKYGVPLRAAALQFSLRDQRVHSTVAGMTSPDQLDKAVEYSHIAIPPALWEEIEKYAVYEGDPEHDK